MKGVGKCVGVWGLGTGGVKRCVGGCGVGKEKWVSGMGSALGWGGDEEKCGERWGCGKMWGVV